MPPIRDAQGRFVSSGAKPSERSFFGMTVSVESMFPTVAKAAEDATFRNLGHAAASIRKDAIASVKFTKEIIGYRRFRTKKGRMIARPVYRPSQPGSPPHGHVNAGYFRQGIRFDVTKDSAVVGPSATKFGESMKAHEFGGGYKGADYPARPLMFPAMERDLPRFAESWRGSVTS